MASFFASFANERCEQWQSSIASEGMKEEKGTDSEVSLLASLQAWAAVAFAVTALVTAFAEAAEAAATPAVGFKEATTYIESMTMPGQMERRVKE